MGKCIKKEKCYKNENMYFQKKNPQFFFGWQILTKSPLWWSRELTFPHFPPARISPFLFGKTKKELFKQKVEKFCRANFFLWMSVVLFSVSKKDDKLRIIKGRREFGVSAFVRVRDLRVRFARFEWIIREYMVRFLGNFRKILCCLIDLYNLTYF